MFKKMYNISKAIKIKYDEGEDDERFEPLILGENNKAIGRISENDGIIFANIRGEREVELSNSIINPNFIDFDVSGRPKNLKMSTMIEYHPDLAVGVGFPPITAVENTLVEILYKNSRKVTKICESEKAIHLKFFFNGKQQKPFSNERLEVVESFLDSEKHPEMKADKIADKTIAEFFSQKSDLIVTNIPNLDVIGHSTDKEAIKIAVSTINTQLKRVIESAIENQYTTIVTADHGTIEQWLYPDGSLDTGHTKNPVPFIFIHPDEKYHNCNVRTGGSLIDIAPTILSLLDIEKPSEMTGEVLVDKSIKSEKVFLLIIDGWGLREDSYGNLLHEFDTPNMDEILKKYPNQQLLAAEEVLGLPKGTVGNSECGHLHMGSGKVIESDRIRIERSIVDKSFYENKAFVSVINHVNKNNSALHLIGIISFFSSHGSIEYLKALMDTAISYRIKRLYIHGLLGRRGEKPYSGAIYVKDLEEYCLKLSKTYSVDYKLVSVIGRFWALDREFNWDRVEKTYNMLFKGIGLII